MRKLSKKALIVSAMLIVTLICSLLSISSFASESEAVWTFSQDSVGDPIYVKDYFDALPRAYEAEVNFPAGTYSKASPIISNYRNNDARDCFGFEINASGNPAMYFYETSYEASTNKVWKTKTYIKFTGYDVRGKGWVRIGVSNEIDSEAGSSVYKLYVNGELVQTVDTYTVSVYEGDTLKAEYTSYIHDIDPIYSQSTNRELSIGNDGKNYFKGSLRSVAVYENALTDTEAANTAKANMQSGDTNLMAYYDSTMSGNSDGFLKDQTANGHDASKAFFTRKDALRDYAYSFAFVGDTQFLMYRDASKGTTSYTGPIYDWIVQNKDEKNIQYVFGLGDVTDRNEYIEWEKALTYHEKLENAEIPYAVIPGNHDDYTNHVKYNAYFGEVEYFTDNIDGYYIDGRVENYYMNFDVGEHKYMVIALQYGAPDEILEWANKVVGENSDRKVIVITHALFDYEGNWSVADTREQASTTVKTLNNGIDFWNDFISLHENIIIAAAGHVDPMDIKHHETVGVNGNTVHSFLIDPQGLDKATDFKTGMVAMFYFSEDGSEVQVEYVSATKTLAAQAVDENADDILYHEKNQFSFKIGETETESRYTEYGLLPESCISAGNKFAVFSGGEFLGGYATWNSATQAAADIFADDNTVEIQILMLADHDNASDALVNNALNYANGSLTLDLGGYTFTGSGTFLNLNNYSDISNVSAANIFVKNGTVRSKSGPIIDNQITNLEYTAEKTWNVTLENLTLGYAEGITGFSNGVLYQAWTNSATSDDSQLGAITNITLNNCTLDLKTNVPDGAVKLFALADNRSLDKIDVSVSVNGGAVLADISDLASVTFYDLNDGSDSIIFGADSDGAYTKLITHTTAKDYAHYSVALPAADGDRYFVEIEDDGTNSTYELQSLKLVGDDITGTVTLDSNVKYLSAVDYPFAVFDQTGKFYGAFDYLMGKQSGAIGSAIYSVTNSKVTVDGATKYKATGNSAYIFMRADYTMRKCPDGTTDEYHNNLSHMRGSAVIDMRGYSIISDSTRNNYIFDATIKQWLGTYEGVAVFDSSYSIKNGTFKVYSSNMLRFKASNSGTDISKKNMNWSFENVTFETLDGATKEGLFVVSDAAGSTSMASVKLDLIDCTFDFTSGTTNKTFTVFGAGFTEASYIKGTVTVSGGKILANNLNKLNFTNFDDANGSTMTFGKGSDGKYLTVVLPRTASFSKFESVKVTTVNGTELILARAAEAAKSTYTLCIKTEYGNVSAEYEDAQEYPFFVFKSDGTFVGAYDLWAKDATASALNNSKTAGSVVLLRRDFVYSGGQYNNLSQTYSVTIDLNGFELKTTSATLFMAQKKNEWETKVTVINGDIVIAGSRPMVRMDTGASFSGNYGFVFEFSGVDIKLPDTAPATDTLVCYSSFADGDPAQYCSFTFTDCTFDLSNATKSFTMFDVSENRCKVNVVINGGEIKTSDYAVTVWKDYTDTVGTVTANSESSLTFGKSDSTGYTKMTVPTGTALPITTVNDGKLTFVKTSVGTAETTYQLADSSLLSYAPKMSITLADSFIMNVYVPVNCTEEFTFNGVTYNSDNSFGGNVVTINEKNYYLVTVALGSSEAARELTLEATVTSGVSVGTATFTFSIPRYAAKVLANDGATDVEKTLAKDVLANIKAAYNYFDTHNDAEEIARVNALIESIIGDYTATPVSTGDTVNAAGVTDVTLNLDAKPTIRFYVTDMSLEFYVGEKKLNTVKNETEGYIELDVYAYALCETITYGDGGSYHISSFLRDAGEAEKTLVAAFIKYTESAAAYRNSVIAAD